MFADPSMFSSLDIQQTPCGNCSVRLQHFIAYVHGAANMTTLAGPAPYSNYALHACKLQIQCQLVRQQTNEMRWCR